MNNTKQLKEIKEEVNYNNTELQIKKNLYILNEKWKQIQKNVNYKNNYIYEVNRKFEDLICSDTRYKEILYETLKPDSEKQKFFMYSIYLKTGIRHELFSGKEKLDDGLKINNDEWQFLFSSEKSEIKKVKYKITNKITKMKLNKSNNQNYIRIFLNNTDIYSLKLEEIAKNHFKLDERNVIKFLIVNKINGIKEHLQLKINLFVMREKWKQYMLPYGFNGVDENHFYKAIGFSNQTFRNYMNSRTIPKTVPKYYLKTGIREEIFLGTESIISEKCIKQQDWIELENKNIFLDNYQLSKSDKELRNNIINKIYKVDFSMSNNLNQKYFDNFIRRNKYKFDKGIMESVIIQKNMEQELITRENV